MIDLENIHFTRKLHFSQKDDKYHIFNVKKTKTVYTLNEISQISQYAFFFQILYSGDL